MSSASSAFWRVLALTPSMWRTTSLRANSEISEDRQVVGCTNVQRPRAVRRADGPRRVARVELLGRPVRTPQPMPELYQPGVVRRGPDPPPQLEAGRPGRAEYARDQRLRHRIARGNIGGYHSGPPHLMREFDHVH